MRVKWRKGKSKRLYKRRKNREILSLPFFFFAIFYPAVRVKIWSFSNASFSLASPAAIRQPQLNIHIPHCVVYDYSSGEIENDIGMEDNEGRMYFCLIFQGIVYIVESCVNFHSSAAVAAFQSIPFPLLHDLRQCQMNEISFAYCDNEHGLALATVYNPRLTAYDELICLLNLIFQFSIFQPDSA